MALTFTQTLQRPIFLGGNVIIVDYNGARVSLAVKSRLSQENIELYYYACLLIVTSKCATLRSSDCTTLNDRSHIRAQILLLDLFL